MTTRSAGPCQPWTPIWCAPLPVSTAAVSGAALEAATEILWAMSGRQFDECVLTLRPCQRDCFGSSWPFYDRWNEFGRTWPFPYNYAGQWFNLGCGGCPGECSCTVIYEAALPQPISSIVQIKIDGAVFPTGSYTVYDYSKLIRTDGHPWPPCNDLNKPDTQVGTWSVTAAFGTEVPTSGQLAVGELARELALAMCGGDGCALPKPVQNLVRQGVSMTFLDPTQVFAAGKVGLYFSDLFISTFNPGGIAARAQAIDVTAAGPRRVTWPP